MSSIETLLPLLRCPSCRGAFDFTSAPPTLLAGAEFAVLRCQCSTFPVVDGIPIIEKHTVGMLDHITGRDYGRQHRAQAVGGTHRSYPIHKIATAFPATDGCRPSIWAAR